MSGPSNIRETNLNRRAEGMFAGGATPAEVHRSLVEVPSLLGAASYQKLSAHLEGLSLTEQDDDAARRTVVHYAMERAVFPSMDEGFALRYLRGLRKAFDVSLPDSLKTLASNDGPAVLETVHHWGVFSILFEAITQIKDLAPRFDRIILFHNRSDVDPRLLELENQFYSELNMDLIRICIGSPLFRNFRQLVTRNTLFVCMGDMPVTPAEETSSPDATAVLCLLDSQGNVARFRTKSLGLRLARMFKADHFKIDYPEEGRTAAEPVKGLPSYRIAAKDWTFWPSLAEYRVVIPN